MNHYTGYELLWLFFIYSFGGWVLETISATLKQRKFANRGLVNGPFCVLYGLTAIAMTVGLQELRGIWLFIFATVYATVAEWVSGHLIEKAFKARWWDYSQRKFNINGRVCLENLVLFGLASCVIIYVTNPFIIKHLKMIPSMVQNVLIGALLAVHLVDNIVSYKIILNLKKVSNEIKDDTIEISEKVKNIIHNKSRLYRRLVNAFPNIKEKVQFKKWTLKEKLEDIKRQIKKEA